MPNTCLRRAVTQSRRNGCKYLGLLQAKSTELLDRIAQSIMAAELVARRGQALMSRTHAMKSRTTTATRAAENMRSKSTCFRVVVSACFWPSDVAQDSPPLQSAFATHSDPATNTATWRYINHFLTCWRHNYSANRPHCDEY